MPSFYFDWRRGLIEAGHRRRGATPKMGQVFRSVNAAASLKAHEVSARQGAGEMELFRSIDAAA